MAAHNELGKEGERLAASHLEAEGYVIRHRNWRYDRKELDIVAEKDGTLVFVEVKTRRGMSFGSPEEAVTEGKIRRIVDSADAYVREYGIDLPVRFDLITVVAGSGRVPLLRHIEDAFYPPLS